MSPWWIPARIDATVTRSFVQQQLLPEEIARLDRPVGFGTSLGAGELTERTYWESINDRAKRLFLILVDIGVPDQIFGLVDDGWDDAELPLPLDHVVRLKLAASRDDRLDRKFYQRQFEYLVKAIDKGKHHVFSDNEAIPLDVVDRTPSIGTRASLVDKVKLPNAPNRNFARRRYPLGKGQGSIPLQDFLDIVESIKGLQSDHVVSYWASYTHLGSGYILLSPCSDYTLKSFLSSTPSSYKNLPKKERRELVVNWILCLVDTLCFLHSRDRSHCYIKPSTVLFRNPNHIFLPDPTKLSPDAWAGHSDKSSFDREWYDYAAPEQWLRPSGPSSPPNRKQGGISNPFSVSPDNGNFNIPRAFENQSTTAMLHSPNAQWNPQQADIFSLGCIILELLSHLVKRSTSKFATFRSAKHKMAGRGGAVLDTSFHKNLGQVEAWMSAVAKDAAAKKVPEAEGGNVFKGIMPMLHVVAGMLSAGPHERPSAFEVQERIYQIIRDYCGIQEPHCVHQYAADLQYAFRGMSIQENGGPAYPTVMRQFPLANTAYGPSRTFHMRADSVDSYSQASGSTGHSTTSSERDGDMSYATARGVPMPQPVRTPNGWPVNGSYIGSPSNQASLYATAQYG